MSLQELLGFNLTGLKKVLDIRLIISIILFFAIIFIVIDVTKMYYKCPKNVIEYRYIPRSFNDEQNDPVPIKQVFGSMFENPSPWINSFTNSGDIKSNRDNNFVRQN